LSVRDLRRASRVPCPAAYEELDRRGRRRWKCPLCTSSAQARQWLSLGWLSPLLAKPSRAQRARESGSFSGSVNRRCLDTGALVSTGALLCAKVSTRQSTVLGGHPEHVICVYTWDWRKREDVKAGARGAALRGLYGAPPLQARHRHRSRGRTLHVRSLNRRRTEVVSRLEFWRFLFALHLRTANVRE
jgi:hypothetical protein